MECCKCTGSRRFGACFNYRCLSFPINSLMADLRSNVPKTTAYFDKSTFIFPSSPWISLSSALDVILESTVREQYHLLCSGLTLGLSCCCSLLLCSKRSWVLEPQLCWSWFGTFSQISDSICFWLLSSQFIRRSKSTAKNSFIRGQFYLILFLIEIWIYDLPELVSPLGDCCNFEKTFESIRWAPPPVSG